MKHIRNILFFDLPRALRDAVKTTRNLGLRYLWTDALCIVQDSVEGKEREMAHMHRVFRDSYLMVVAANASSSEQGFLEVYDDQSTVISLPLRLEDGRVGNILLPQKGTELNREPPHERPGRSRKPS